jgi:hypothetical protein
MKSLRDDCFQAAQRPVFYLLGFAAIIKISVLLISGPSFDPDSNGDNAYADAILDHGRAFAPLVWGAEAIPLFIFRFPGYPLVLAGARLASTEHYAYRYFAVHAQRCRVLLDLSRSGEIVFV